MKYEIEICLFRKITMSRNARIIRIIAVVVIPVQINGMGLLTGANRIIALRMNRIIASANHALYIMFMYSRKAVFNPVVSAMTILVRCRSIRAARKAPVMIAVSFIEAVVLLYRIVSVSSNDTEAKRLILKIVNRFLRMGGHEITSEVPGASISGWRLKLRVASPEIMLFLPKIVSAVMIKRQTERRIKLKSTLIFSGRGSWPSARPAEA
jgi:hypothetical protein